MVSCLRSLCQLAATLRDCSHQRALGGRGSYDYIRCNPSIIYDYYGFRQNPMRLSTPAGVSQRWQMILFNGLKRAGIKSRLDESRGFDHGLFVPLSLMYPNADIPCIPVSLVNTLDPLAHIEMGQALSGLNQQNVLVMGSGFTFHNLETVFSCPSPLRLNSKMTHLKPGCSRCVAARL